jgi:nucleolar protein 56
VNTDVTIVCFQTAAVNCLLWPPLLCYWVLGFSFQCLNYVLSLVCASAAADLRRAQLGLAHSYSRAKVKFNVNKVDNMVIQAIALLDTLDKDINTFIMRVREWYSWHFPELVKVRRGTGALVCRFYSS